MRSFYPVSSLNNHVQTQARFVYPSFIYHGAEKSSQSDIRA